MDLKKKNVDSIGNKTGVVRVFKFNNNSWEKIGSDIEGEAAYDYFGNAVKISSDGKFLVAGAKKNDGNNSAYTGQIRVYKNVDNNWIQVGSDINGDSAWVI